MRLSEKTLELNICAQINERTSRRHIWFGLTQKQEAKAGFDACARFNGRLIIFQFKASNYTLSNGLRRFYGSHDQMQNLINRCHGYFRSVFYVFPLVGNTLELHREGGDVVSSTWLMDVAILRNPLPLPTIRNSRNIRKNHVHYIDVVPGQAIIHSEPFQSELIKIQDYFSEGSNGSDGLNYLFQEDFESFYKFCKTLDPHSKGLILI